MNYRPLYSRTCDPVTQNDLTLRKIPYIVTYSDFTGFGVIKGHRVTRKINPEVPI